MMFLGDLKQKWFDKGYEAGYKACEKVQAAKLKKACLTGQDMAYKKVLDLMEEKEIGDEGKDK